MVGTVRNSLIKRLVSELPHGAPLDVAALAGAGVSPKRASDYVSNGWLTRLGRGVYAFPNDEIRVHESVVMLQRHMPGLHVAGRSALGLNGIRHNLGRRETLVLWGDSRPSLPSWFSSRFRVRYSSASLFDWKDEKFRARTISTPPGVTQGLRISVPERAILELLSEVGTHQDLEEARNLFDGFRTPRQDVLGHLLGCCRSVKTVRLFLAWARETGVVDVERLVKEYSPPQGSSKRWMKRLKDGTLLTLPAPVHG